MEKAGHNSHAWDPAELLWDPLALCAAERVHTEPPAASHASSVSANRLSDGDAGPVSTSEGSRGACKILCQVRARNGWLLDREEVPPQLPPCRAG